MKYVLPIMTIQKLRSGPFFLEADVGVGRIRANNQERIINNPSKQVQPLQGFIICWITLHQLIFSDQRSQYIDMGTFYRNFTCSLTRSSNVSKL